MKYFVHQKHYNRVVLMIDSNVIDLEEMADFLLESGFNILKATTAKEGISLLKRYKPDLIILDYQLSDMKADSFLKRIKFRLNVKNPPKIILISKSMPNNILDFFEIGVDNYFSKPIVNRMLIDEVVHLLQDQYRSEIGKG